MLGLILLGCVICICRCFCCRSSPKSRSRSLDKLGKRLDDTDDRTPLIAKESNAQKRRDEMRRKWNIPVCAKVN